MDFLGHCRRHVIANVSERERVRMRPYSPTVDVSLFLAPSKLMRLTVVYIYAYPPLLSF